MTIDELQVVVTANTNQLKKELASVRTDLGKVQNSTSSIANRVPKHFGIAATAASAFGNVLANVVSAGFGAVKDSVGGAISRLDTLKNYPRVMSSLGYSTDDANKSIKLLGDRILGLPTSLDQIVNSTQQLATVSPNLASATYRAIALNDAFLAGGASTERATEAGIQFNQMLATGKADMQSWNSIVMTIPGQMQQVAKSMLGASGTTSQLKAKIDDGTITVQQLADEFVKLDQKGLPGFASFADQARAATGGVGASIENVKTAIVRGLAQIMDAIGQANIASFFQMIINAINAVVPYVVAFVRIMVMAVNFVSSLFGGGKKKADGMTKSVDATAGAMGGVAAQADDATGAIGGTTKAAKKLQNQLASFDEMNVLQPPSDSGSGGGGGGGAGAGGTGMDFGDVDAGASSLDKVQKIVDGILGTFKQIGQFAKQIWDSAPIQAFVGAMASYGQFLWDFWSSVGKVIWDNLVNIWTLIQPNVMLGVNNLVTLWTNFWLAMQTTIETYSQPIIDGVTGLLQSIFDDAITPYTVLIAQVWADFTGMLLDTWNKYGAGILDSIGQFVVNTIALFQKIWDDVLAPIIQPFLEMLSSLWEEHIKGMVDQGLQFVAKLIQFALDIYNHFIAPIVGFLLDVLKPAFAFIGQFIAGVFGSVFGALADIVGNIFKILGGLIDFISGVFSGNWSRAWNGIVSMFSGIFGGIGAIAKLPLNLLIDLINSFIAGINNIKIPDWVPGVGGKNLNIPKIPKLARGGIIDKATLAVVGESGKEAVMPLENNTGWIDLLASKLNAQGGNGQPMQVTVKIGEDTIIRKVVDGINDLSYQNGEAVIQV